MTGQEGILISLDFNKVFDRVEHKFMFRVLEKLGFGEKFISWLKLLYSTATGKVKVNVILTNEFKLNRSARQICTTSSLLYSMVVEPLSELLKRDTRVRGIDLPGGGKCVIQQFADDTTLVVKNMDSVNRALHLINVYGRASGSRINVSKSELLFINSVSPAQESIQLKLQPKSVKILGTYIGVNSAVARDETWAGILNKIEAVLNWWRMRDLKLNGRVVVLNNLVLSKLNYALRVLDFPSWALTRINEIITKFIWGSTVSKIARRTLISKHVEGGLKLLDVDSKKKAFRITFVRKY